MGGAGETLRQTQDAVRRANDRFRNVAIAAAWDGQTMLPFLCECADPDCLGRVDMTTADYADVHVDVDKYVIVRGHETADGERVVDDRDGFLVMLKTDGAA
jgi:hypothetical protein